MDKRIAYYTKKVAEYGSVHHSEHRNPYRPERLPKYRKMMHERIAKQ